MTPQTALDETIKLFGLKAKDLAEASGIGENRISRYRKGANMDLNTFFSLYRALPERARIHCWMLIMMQDEEADNSFPLPTDGAKGLYSAA